MRAVPVVPIALCVAVLCGGRLAAQQPGEGVVIYQRVAALEARDTGKGPAANIPIQVSGSTGLKLAFVARGSGGVTRVPLNMFDEKAQDNTTALSYAWVDETWRPILYRCDRFRYNGGNIDSRVKPDTQYVNIRFHGSPTPGQQGAVSIRNLVLYRGEDTEPPTTPAAPTASIADGGVQLQWREPADNVGVALYAISRAGADGRFVKIAQTSDTTFVDRTAPAGVNRYRILAADFQDNLSAWSDSASVTVPAAGTLAPRSTQYEQDRQAYAADIRRIHDAGAGKVVRGRVFQFGDSLSGATLYQLEAEAALGRYMVEARGRAGWTTQQGRGAIERDLRELRPEFCLILYGTNNSKDRGSIGAAMDDLQAMVRACANAGAVPLVATIPPRGFDDPNSRPEADYNAALVKTFRANRIPIAYIFEDLIPRRDRRSYLAGDGVHWDREAFELTARVWRQAMEQVTFALLDRPE